MQQTAHKARSQLLMYTSDTGLRGIVKHTSATTPDQRCRKRLREQFDRDTGRVLDLVSVWDDQQPAQPAQLAEEPLNVTLIAFALPHKRNALSSRPIAEFFDLWRDCEARVDWARLVAEAVADLPLRFVFDVTLSNATAWLHTASASDRRHIMNVACANNGHLGLAARDSAPCATGALDPETVARFLRSTGLVDLLAGALLRFPSASPSLIELPMDVLMTIAKATRTTEESPVSWASMGMRLVCNRMCFAATCGYATPGIRAFLGLPSYVDPKDVPGDLVAMKTSSERIVFRLVRNLGGALRGGTVRIACLTHDARQQQGVRTPNYPLCCRIREGWIEAMTQCIGNVSAEISSETLTTMVPKMVSSQMEYLRKFTSAQSLVLLQRVASRNNAQRTTQLVQDGDGQSGLSGQYHLALLSSDSIHLLGTTSADDLDDVGCVEFVVALRVGRTMRIHDRLADDFGCGCKSSMVRLWRVGSSLVVVCPTASEAEGPRFTPSICTM